MTILPLAAILRDVKPNSTLLCSTMHDRRHVNFQAHRRKTITWHTCDRHCNCTEGALKGMAGISYSLVKVSPF